MEAEGRRYTPALPIAQESTHVLRLDPFGALVTQKAFGEEFLGTYNEIGYVGGTPGPAGTVTTVALATTYTGLVLSNPISSGILVSIHDVVASFNIVFPAAAYIGLMVGYSATTDVVQSVPVTTGRSSKIGTVTTPKAKLASGATLQGTPTVAKVFGHCLANAAGTFESQLEASIILIPGAWCAIYTSTVSGAAALMATFQWDEIRII